MTNAAWPGRHAAFVHHDPNGLSTSKLKLACVNVEMLTTRSWGVVHALRGASEATMVVADGGASLDCI
jgi:hypothetical protein